MQHAYPLYPRSHNIKCLKDSHGTSPPARELVFTECRICMSAASPEHDHEENSLADIENARVKKREERERGGEVRDVKKNPEKCLTGY